MLGITSQKILLGPTYKMVKKIVYKFDVKTHVLVPKHIKLKKEEISEILQHYNIKKSQLPKIKKTDPAIEELEVEKGDVIKIIRKSPTVGETFFYRVVV